MQQILFLIQKEFIQVFRDRAIIFIIFVMPLVQVLLLGSAVSTDIKHIKTIICDLDRTPSSRELIKRFQHTQYFDLQFVESNQASITKYIDEGRASITIVIPTRFEKDLKRNQTPTVQILVDGQDSNSSLIAMGYANRIVQAFSLEKLQNSLVRNPEKFLQIHLVEPETRIWYNPNLEAKNYMIPGIVIILLTAVTTLLTALGLVREKEIGTLEQLMVTPVKSYQLMIGKTVPFAILGLIEIAFAIALAKLWYQIPIQGNLLLFFGFALIFMFTTLGVGIFVSTISKTQQQALFLAWFFMVFAILMSGFMFPIENMPKIMQYLTYINPVRYFITIVRELFLKGSGLSYLWLQGVIMTIFSILIITFSAIRFQKRVG